MEKQFGNRLYQVFGTTKNGFDVLRWSDIVKAIPSAGVNSPVDGKMTSVWRNGKIYCPGHFLNKATLGGVRKWLFTNQDVKVVKDGSMRAYLSYGGRKHEVRAIMFSPDGYDHLKTVSRDDFLSIYHYITRHFSFEMRYYESDNNFLVAIWNNQKGDLDPDGKALPYMKALISPKGDYMIISMHPHRDKKN